MPLYAKHSKKERKLATEQRIEADRAAGGTNPGSIHAGGVAAARILESSRRSLGVLLGVMPEELYFVPSGTVANNVAILGWCAGRPAGHIVTSDFEHPSVAEPVAELERRGWRVTRVESGNDGVVSVTDVKKAIQSDTALVTVMMVQNEIGTIQPIHEIAKVVRAERVCRGLNRFDATSIVFHTDACQAIGWLPAAINALGADMVTLSGRKLDESVHAGLLYVRRGVNISPLIFGGGQEHGIWSGTEDVRATDALARGFERAERSRVKNVGRVEKVRDDVIERVLREIKGARVNGSRKDRVANNVNVSFDGVEGESIVLGLDACGIDASPGAACSARIQRGSDRVRLSCGHDVTLREAKKIIGALKHVVERARRIVI